MRTLTATLTAAQKAMGQPLYKAVFTKSGQTTRTYGCDTTNRILNMSHPESEWSQSATILIDNRDGNLTSLDLTGYTCTISYGYTTSSGDEYSACAPLEVVAQRGDTILRPHGDLLTQFSAKGIFDFMAEDEASDDYSPEDINTDTIKTILTAIAQATLACFSHCKAYTITFDSEDTLIDSYAPADYFRVTFRESRLSAFKKALEYTKCKARIEDDGEIHVFEPTISGTSYDYEYNDAVTNHNFFEKSVRERLVIPNRVYVSSHPDHSPNYMSYAVDTTSYNALGRYQNEYHRLRLTGNTQATNIATAILQGHQIGQEKGHGYAPLNCGQEVMDYVKITDSVANDTRTGNIGYLKRKAGPRVFEFDFGFGELELSARRSLLPARGGVSDTTESLRDAYYQLIDLYNRLEMDLDMTIENQKIIARNLELLWNAEIQVAINEVMPKLHVTDQLIIPVIIA